jgi:hypothetical protein
MQGQRTNNVIRLQKNPNGLGTLDMPFHGGRYEIVSAGRDPSLGFIGSDPYNAAVFTGLVVPSTPSSAIGNARYLFMLARAQFQTGEKGVRLVGIRQYADLVARVAGEDVPTQVFHKEILAPMFRPPDGSISWHVMIINKTARDTRNPANADSFIYQDSYSPALLYQTSAPYSPPNGGRPWGTSIGASLGNMHELRYTWQKDHVEYALDIPIPLPCDVALFASVRQNNPTTNPSGTGLSPTQIAALDPEEQFLVAFNDTAQYGRIAGSLVFEENF